MAKGGLLNQVPQIDLPTTMDCNVISIGGQTPEEYANLIAQKVTNKNGEPGSYGTGTIKLLTGTVPNIEEKVLFDGLEWYVGLNESDKLYLFRAHKNDDTSYTNSNDYETVKNTSYLDSNLRKAVLSLLSSMSVTARQIILNVTQECQFQSQGSDFTKFSDKIWVLTLKNISNTTNFNNIVNINSQNFVKNISGPVFGKIDNVINELKDSLSNSAFFADRYIFDQRWLNSSIKNNYGYYNWGMSKGYGNWPVGNISAESNYKAGFIYAICLDKSKL